jgi:hypothetical protein
MRTLLPEPNERYFPKVMRAVQITFVDGHAMDSVRRYFQTAHVVVGEGN